MDDAGDGQETGEGKESPVSDAGERLTDGLVGRMRHTRAHVT